MIDLGAIADGLVPDPAGYWTAGPTEEPISYPAGDSELCAGVEESSFWFAYRNRAIAAAVARFPPRGAIFDVGGGNGFVAKALADRGHDVVLVEPSRSGAGRAVQRGLENVVCGTLAGARFHPRTAGAAGLFDVVEHIEDDVAFLRSLRSLLTDGAPLYLTVPAFPSLWSADDRDAGHYRRYRRQTLAATLERAGFEVMYATYFFSPLMLPLFVFRALPSRLGVHKRVDARSIARTHAGGGIGGRMMAPFLAAELRMIERGRSLPTGTSILAVARSILSA